VTRKLYVLNGPNLNMLGQREPELYGSATLEDVRADCVRLADELGLDLFFAQSNAEHQIVEWLHDAYREKATVVINPPYRSSTRSECWMPRSSRSTSPTSTPAMPPIRTLSSRQSRAS
jgi:hypothetical protein